MGHGSTPASAAASMDEGASIAIASLLGAAAGVLHAKSEQKTANLTDITGKKP
jgi:hypothetical protein